jgi:predicted RNA-binding Zn-ribbon protein involved in translation (DUF1610 family)
MKRLGSLILTLVGIVLVLLGLLFLVGAAGKASRFVVAALSLGLGGVLVGSGARLFKQAEAASPGRLRSELLALARRRNGELSEADVLAALGPRAAGAAAVLAGLEAEGLCVGQRKDGAAYYVFASLQPRLTVRRCEYCKLEVSLAATETTCPHCGGSIKSQVESRSLSGGQVYRMDE